MFLIPVQQEDFINNTQSVAMTQSSSHSSAESSTGDLSACSSGCFVQSFNWHMSLHGNPLSRQVQLGNLHNLLQLDDRSSSTALDAGSPPIQSMASFPSSMHHPFPTVEGIS